MVQEKKSSAKRLLDGIMGGASARSDTGVQPDGEEGDSSILQHRQERMHPHMRKEEKKTSYVSKMSVDPTLCRIQQRPNRIYELLTPENCADLIESIDAHGQKVPAIARETGEKGQPFEIIAGRRRHWVAQHLNRDVVIELRVLTDEEAFLLSEAENDGRLDLSDYEKAKGWADALGSFYGGKVERLAVAINKPRETVYDFLRLAELDERVVKAYRSVLDIKRLHAAKLTPLMKSAATRERVLKRADELAGAQGKGNGADGTAVFKALVNAARPPKARSGVLVEHHATDANNKPVFTLTRTSRGGVSIVFAKKIECSKSEVKSLLEKAVDEHLG